jgi:hypothetical protein
MFENKTLNKMFGPKRTNYSGDRKKLHNKHLCDLYSSFIMVT